MRTAGKQAERFIRDLPAAFPPSRAAGLGIKGFVPPAWERNLSTLVVIGWGVTAAPGSASSRLDGRPFLSVREHFRTQRAVRQAAWRRHALEVGVLYGAEQRQRNPNE